MNIKFLQVALGVVLAASTVSASAQKVYNEGVITYSVSSAMGDAESKTYFKGDSIASNFQAGPATITTIVTRGGGYIAVLVDVSAFNVKKAGIATPAEAEEAHSQQPVFTFTPTTETKTISGFNCKKVIAKDAKGASYDVWITNDIAVSGKPLVTFLANAGGFPIQYTAFQSGQTSNVTLKAITESKVPAGAFSVPKDYDKITLTELKEMAKQGGGN